MSSSGHLALVPVLLRLPYRELDPELRKSFEVALHAGSAGALAIALRAEVPEMARPRRAVHLLLTAVPPALAGLYLERQVESRLGGPRPVAAAQVGAGLALWLADRRPARRSEPGLLDALAVGVAQAAALVPGVSRAGASLSAARMRGLARPASARLARQAALPVTVGAGLLKGLRGQVPRELAGPFAAGALAALASGVAARGLSARVERADSYAPLAAYRIGLGLAALIGGRRQ